MRQHHRHNQWQLTDGLYLPHSYEEPRKLSWWDDIGFVLSGRRVMIWWAHPRMSYADAVEERAWKEMAPPPSDFPELLARQPGEKTWKKVGRSRKKVVGYKASPKSEAKQESYDQLFATEKRLKLEGIDFEVRPSISVKALAWGLGVELCVPLEVRNENDAKVLVGLVRKLLKGETSLDAEFRGYLFGRKEWLDEAGLRNNSD